MKCLASTSNAVWLLLWFGQSVLFLKLKINESKFLETNFCFVEASFCLHTHSYDNLYCDIPRNYFSIIAKSPNAHGCTTWFSFSVTILECIFSIFINVKFALLMHEHCELWYVKTVRYVRNKLKNFAVCQFLWHTQITALIENILSLIRE